jgi:integrase/recombinase XerD
VRLSRAVDRWLGELARAGRTESSRDSYERYLHKFIVHVERRKQDVGVREVTVDDCRTFLDRWQNHAASTVGSIHSALNGLFVWLLREEEIDQNPMVRIARPRRPRPGETEVVITTRSDVERMLGVVEDWQEALCLSVLLYMGVRRNASSRVRWRDVDLTEGTIRVREKGNKYSTNPMPHELLALLLAAVESGDVACRADDYLIPNRRPGAVRRKERSDKVIWETVKKLAKRAGVASTTHALRRAFAVEFLSTHPGEIEGLQALMNHSRIDTTEVYLRAFERTKAMEAVRDLSWSGLRFQSYRGKAHTGFEPVPPP